MAVPAASEEAQAAHSAQEEVGGADRVEGSGGVAEGVGVAEDSEAVEEERGRGRNRAQVNRVRGNLTEQYTNSGFDAHPYPLNVLESPRIPSYQETFGFSGGPLVIPKVYNGGSKTSWFASYNLQRSRTGLDSFSPFPPWQSAQEIFRRRHRVRQYI